MIQKQFEINDTKVVIEIKKKGLLNADVAILKFKSSILEEEILTNNVELNNSDKNCNALELLARIELSKIELQIDDAQELDNVDELSTELMQLLETASECDLARIEQNLNNNFYND